MGAFTAPHKAKKTSTDASKERYRKLVTDGRKALADTDVVVPSNAAPSIYTSHDLEGIDENDNLEAQWDGRVPEYQRGEIEDLESAQRLTFENLRELESLPQPQLYHDVEV